MKESKNKLLIHIVGPTAIGKTSMSIKVANHYKTEIISADSRQFFKELNIGTAKASEEELNEAPHHLINFLSIKEDFNVSDYQNVAIDHIKQIFNLNDVAVMTGGSGLYLHSIWFGFDESLPDPNPKLRAELEKGFKGQGIDFLIEELKNVDEEALELVDQQNPMRLMRAIEISSASDKSYSSYRSNDAVERPFKQLKIALTMDRKQLHERINKRVDAMMEAGLLKEAKSLLPFRNKNALQTVGYRELFRYFDGEFTLEEAVEKIKTNSRRYAKRQMTWLRRYDDIVYHEAGDFESIIKTIDQTLNNL
jgi:tRNA dimethylallyltransferase